VSKRLELKDEEFSVERKKAEGKTDEVIKDRDEALATANQLRAKLSEIIKDKMKNETDAQSKHQKMENEFLNQIKQKEKEKRLLNEKIN